MEHKRILSHIDYTVLKAVTEWSQIERLCKDAIRLETASVCIPPAYVRRAKEMFGSKLNVCTVIGFPLGYSTTEAKVFETKNAILNGATEIDMVINLGDVKNGDFDKVEAEIKAIRTATGSHVLKVIVETCYLTEDEKIKLCSIITSAGADFIKTSTGFGTAGANVEDILLLKQHIGPKVSMKASGGVRTKEEMIQYIELGCERIGASSITDLE